MTKQKDQFAAANVQLLVVGQGDPELTQLVCKEYDAWYQCLGDTDRKSYKLYGLPYTSYSALLEKSVREGSKKAKDDGHAQNWSRTFSGESDWLQLGGAVLIDRQGIVRYIHRAKTVADHVDVSALLKAASNLNKAVKKG